MSRRLPVAYVSNKNPDIASCEIIEFDEPVDLFLKVTYSDGNWNSVSLLPYTSAFDPGEITYEPMLQLISEPIKDIRVILQFLN